VIPLVGSAPDKILISTKAKKLPAVRFTAAYKNPQHLQIGTVDFDKFRRRGGQVQSAATRRQRKILKSALSVRVNQNPNFETF
jgi:hypothetical protein